MRPINASLPSQSTHKNRTTTPKGPRKRAFPFWDVLFRHGKYQRLLSSAKLLARASRVLSRPIESLLNSFRTHPDSISPSWARIHR